ncbi:TRAF-type zinc finger domain-containing protein 1-like isoform X2 [Cloeon dipterum]|uniref:TRAF-type zinc finger domain-containing protein 1-like isoform X2 n=1 Tax=Cloeon dipterum TaxID=197152 RepID=UPI00321FB156
MEEEMEICSNCKREIRSVNYVTHSVHCHRNIVICNKCNEPVPRAELAAHDASEHKLRSCSACGAQVEKALMQKHAKEDCPHRKITCTFCELELEAKEAIEHVSYCGTRTEKCSECGEFVMLKYQALHLDSNHGFLKLEDEPGPPASWEAPTIKAIVKAEPSRPILKSAIRPASTVQAASIKKSVPNTVRFAPIEKPAPAVEKPPVGKSEGRQTRFSHNKIGAEVKPIVLANPESESKTEKNVPVNDEEADRLLAFKLAQDEMEMMSKYQLDGILQQRRKVIEASEKSKISVIESNSVTQEELQKPCEIMGAVGGKFRKQKSPEAKVLENEPRADEEKTKDPDNTFEDVQIPCEFCETLIPASRLLIHQTGCRPDLACYIPYRPNKTSKPVHENEHATGEAENPPTRTKTMIPCDLCHTSIQANMFIQHQLACEIKHLPARGNKPKALVMPLSGRTLRASNSIEESILPALQDLEKEADGKPGLRPSFSARDYTEMRSTQSNSHYSEKAKDEEKVKQGAVPKQKPKSIKKYRAPQPPQLDKSKEP